MAIGSSLGITLPTQGGNSNTWGTDLNTELQKIIDAVEAQVPASAIDFSADLDFNNVAAVDLAHTSYRAQGSAPTELRSIYFDTAGNLYIRNGANSTVQITSGSGLSGAGGSITGGSYGSSGVELSWDGTQYKFKDGSGASDYAPVYMSDLVLRDTSANGLTFTVGSMSSDYSLSWPTAVASGATTILQSDASGNLSWSNTFSTDITLSGSAELKHGDRILYVPAIAGFGDSADSAGSGAMNIDTSAGTDSFYIPIPLKQGDRIKSIDLTFVGGDTSSKGYGLYYLDRSAGSSGTSISNTTSTASGVTTVTMSSINYTIGANSEDIIYFVMTAASTGDDIVGIQVTYDRP